MHLEYKVRLPDHDWVVGNRHKLIPSVYTAVLIKPDGMGREDAVSYAGPTFIGVRSGKHSSSTAATHAKDFKRMLELPDFDPFLKTESGKLKPVLIFTVDGGPDENPRYPKTINYAVQHFLDHDADGIFIATNAPGQSKYNRCERIMSRLTKEMSMLVIPHDTFGNHLDADGNTIDEELELKNFGHAGRVLAEVWSGLVINNFNVVSEYQEPDEELPSLRDISPAWYVEHVRESQYMVQVRFSTLFALLETHAVASNAKFVHLYFTDYQVR